MKELKFCDRVIACESDGGGLLYWPAEWTEELEGHGFIDAACHILTCLPRVAVEVPWIIGSASKTLNGTERSDSPSHMKGFAFDMSPMYSPDVIIADGAPIMGLAWNLINLFHIAAASDGTIPFVVEGDHLHVQPQAGIPASKGIVYACWTLPTWYQVHSMLQNSPIGEALLNSVWKLDALKPAVYTPSRDIVEEMLEMLDFNSVDGAPAVSSDKNDEQSEIKIV